MVSLLSVGDDGLYANERAVKERPTAAYHASWRRRPRCPSRRLANSVEYIAYVPGPKQEAQLSPRDRAMRRVN